MFSVTATNVFAAVVDLNWILIRCAGFSAIAFLVHDDSKWSKFTKWRVGIVLITASIHMIDEN
jgi:Na+/phosphate symporter